MLQIFLKSDKDATTQEIKDFSKGAWINLSRATQEDIEKIAELLGLTNEDLMDSLDNSELPRVETQENALIIFLRTPSDIAVTGQFTNTLTMVITPEYFITISPFEEPLLEGLKNSSIDFSIRDFEDPLIYILNRSADLYTKQIRLIRKSIEAQKKDIQNINDDDILLLTKNEEILNQYLASLVPMKIAIENLFTARQLSLDESESDLFQDTLNNIRQSIDICSVNLKSIRSLRDSYQIIFTNRLNRKITFLTGFTIIMTIPTIVASVFGMNVHLPFESHPYAFGIIMSMAMGVSLLCFAYFLWKKLL